MIIYINYIIYMCVCLYILICLSKRWTKSPNLWLFLLCFKQSRRHIPTNVFFSLKDKHCYDEPDVIPALHIHYSHKPICGIDFMQIFQGICINKVLINTSEETSVLFDTKVFLIMKGKVRCPQVKLNKWIAIKKHGEFCIPHLLFFWPVMEQ